MRKTEASSIKVGILFACIILTSTQLLSRRNLYAKPVTQTSDRGLALGLNHFSAHCAGCHGQSGKADTERGRQVKAADLTAAGVQNKRDAELSRIIAEGVPGTAMPAFGKTHTPEEIRHVIMFLRKLPTLTPEERQRLEAAVPAEARHAHGAQPQGEAHRHDRQPAQAEHRHEAQPAGRTAPANAAPAPHQHDRPGAAGVGGDAHSDHGGHDMSAMMTTLTGGPFKSMRAIGSGTSLLPASSPAFMWMGMKGDWMVMAHGDVKFGFNHQGGPRGVNKAESQNWLMVMAERSAGGGRLMLRGMFSAEPLTTPRRGFPLLFQTGETYDGRPLIDAQHPHDLFMELAASYTAPLSENVSISLYGGPVGEPALGPIAFMHRPSGYEMPSAALGHHWQDSTHIAHGVFTLGLRAGRFKIESSVFRGAEPDENRATIDFGKLDSYSGRLWFTPTADWTMQVSYGYLTNPELAEPGDLRRFTASVHHNRSWRQGYWASSLVWGRNDEEHGVTNAYLLESTVNFLDRNYLYTRAEWGDKAGLLQENIFGRPGLIPARHVGDDHHGDEGEGDALDELAERPFRVAAFTFGGVRDFVTTDKFRLGLGADVTFNRVPDGLKPIYGSSPTGFHIFLRLRPGRM